MIEGGVTKSGQLGAKEEGNFAINGDFVNGGGGSVWGGGDEGVTLGFEFGEAGGGVVCIRTLMAVEG